MPNWCSTNIKITHNDLNKMAMLQNMLDKWTKHNYMSNGFGENWLGNIVLGAEIGTVDTEEDTDLRCRGDISYMEFNPRSIYVATETAWAPMLKMWQKLCDKYLPGAEILYDAEEPGCGLFCYNDPEFEGKYRIDSWDNDEVESDYCATEECVVDVLQSVLNTDEKNIEKLLEMFESSGETENMSIHKWEYADISEFD